MTDTCGKCHSPSLIALGVGTQRLEEALIQHFPDKVIQRVDRDTMTRKGQLEATLTAFANGQTHCLIGTQMLAKGHDFANLTLVAIIDIDSGLYSSDFRAIERMGQLIMQVAGRAGRAHRAGQVICQTHNPDNPLLKQLIDADYPSFLQTVLSHRQQAKLPPFQHFAMLRADANSPGVSLEFLHRAKRQAQQLGLPADILGPIPAIMEKRAGRFRAQLLIATAQRGELKALLTPLVSWLRGQERSVKGRCRWSVDVDPQDMF